jgi:lysozyme
MIPEGLKNMLIRHEGLKLIPYLCPAGKKTIGAGHNIEANSLPPHIDDYLVKNKCITKDMAMELLENDVTKAVTDCGILYRHFDKFSERRQWALIDFLFNVGLNTARSFRNTNKAINKEDWEAAAKGLENSLWFRQVGLRGPEIVEMVRHG